MDHLSKKIIESWNANANGWTTAVRNNALESRKLVTNDAIVNAVMKCEGNRVLDVGCGEGWLSFALSNKGKHVTGFDGSEALINHALAGVNDGNINSTRFLTVSYEYFLQQPSLVGSGFDVVVCNFSLLDEKIDSLLRGLKTITKPGGHLLIQTLHPYSSLGDFAYQDGWREETFSSLSGKWSPMPWYFRTMGSWLRELTSAGWRILEIEEPLHPETKKPISLILKGQKL